MSRSANSTGRSAVVFHAYSKLLFCWPLILVGPILWFVAGAEPGPVRAEILGWVYLVLAVTVIIAVSIDFERNHAFFWLIVFVAFLFLGMWLEEKPGFTFFGNIYRFFDSLDVRYSRGFGLAVSILLAGPFVVMLIWARLQHKWRITHNEFEHYSWGRADDSLARGAKRVRTTYPDLLELLLAGAGTLIVYSATGRSELRRIHNVPLLPLLRRRIDRILETTAVTDYPDELADEEYEAEREEADATNPANESDDQEIGNERL